MANCPVVNPGAPCEPGSEECYYVIAIGLCDGPNPPGDRRIRAAAVGSKLLANGTVISKRYILDVSEAKLQKAGIPILYRVPGLPAADVVCNK